MLTITTPTIEFENRGLTHPVAASTRLYSHSPDRDLSLTELAEVINISPTYFGEFIQTGDGSFTAPVCDSTAVNRRN